ncbi:MAG: exonuclease domain-containing protein [Weeksellaceae bacterium]
MKYAILDIEATGGKAGTEKIIDIAIYQFDGQLITDKFGSMVNPQRKIDPYVQRLTGITDKMVLRAPKFYEIAKRVIEITEDCIIVAHGVHFDYRMLKQEFKELGYPFERPTLDTVVLSQKLIPEAESHSLGKLCKSLGIPVSSRHRADGDTLATLELFKILLEKDAQKNIIQTYAKKEPDSKQQVQKLLNLEHSLPSKTGVFYLHNAKGKIIYIGAAKNIAHEVNHVFIQRNENAHRIQSLVENITFELTGSYLIALLKAKDERKGKKNLINLKTDSFTYGVYTDEEQVLKIEKFEKERRQPLMIFDHRKKAEAKIKSWLKKYPDYSTLNKLSKQIKADVNFQDQNFILLDKGRDKTETSFIEVYNNLILGYGFYKFHNQIEELSIRENIRVPLSNSMYNVVLLKTFIHQKKYTQLIPYTKKDAIKIPNINERFRSKNK